MSKALYWQPLPPPNRKHFDAEDEIDLRHALARRYSDYDGSIRDEFPVGGEAVPFLEGMAVSGSKAAEELIGVLQEYGEVLIIIDE